MKALVVYDSQYGNTEKIAKAVAASVKATVKLATRASALDIEGVELLIVGSPTQGGRPTVAIQQFLNHLPHTSLKGVSVAAFDTRFREENLGFWPRLLVKSIGYAAPKIAQELIRHRGTLVVKPEGFVVDNTKGPLASGEIYRARQWLTRFIASRPTN